MWFSQNWEKLLFRFFGIGCFAFAIVFLLKENVTAFASTSAAAIFCFLYANFTKFKRFKGLGFEAELWEDKQAEAAALIDQLKEIVAIYSREALLSRVKHGRLYSEITERERWKEIWALHKQLLSEHGKLGQAINFDELKRELDTYFIFDAMIPTYRSIARLMEEGRQEAGRKISMEHPQPIKDAAAYGKRLEQKRSIQHNLSDPFELVQKRNLSAALRNWYDSESKALQAVFDVKIMLKESDDQDLKFFSEIEAGPPLKITDELIEKFAELANRRQ